MKNFSENAKWAGVLITGKKMTPSQTLDVMMKLDLSLRSGFHIHFNSKANSVTKRLSEEAKLHKLFDGLAHDYNQSLMLDEGFYVDMLRSSWIGGANSWFLKDGTIFHHANVGKYPSTNDIVSYWKNIAKMFPFLELNITVFDCELTSVLSVIGGNVYVDDDSLDLVNNPSYFNELKEFMLFNMNISNGEVKVEDADLNVHFENLPTLEKLIELSTPNPNYEDCYVDDEQVEYIVQQTKKQVDEFLDKQKAQSKLIKVCVEHAKHHVNANDAEMAGVEVVGYSCATSSQSLFKEFIEFSRYQLDNTDLKSLHDFAFKFKMDLEENKNHPVHQFLKTETLKDLFKENKQYKLDLTDGLSVIFESCEP